MSGNFRTWQIAIAAFGLAGALAFTVYHRAGGVEATSERAGDNSFSADNSVKEIAGYKNWTKVNPRPQLMPGRVATDCAIWVSPEGVVLDGANNPHRNKHFTVYVNDVGQTAMLSQKQPRFPEGSIIVKEKLPDEYSQSPELLTVMIKQKKGFNPASGDWEYMVVDGAGTKVEGRGNLENCQGCHVGNRKTDYIFRTYLSGEAQGKLR